MTIGRRRHDGFRKLNRLAAYRAGHTIYSERVARQKKREQALNSLTRRAIAIAIAVLAHRRKALEECACECECCPSGVAFRLAGQWPGLRFMDSGATPPVREFLARKVRDGASSAQLADVILAAWQQITAAMAPVIGQRGVTAMYRRSLHLAIAAHPWLGAAQPGGLAAMDLGALRAAMERQGSADAAAGGGALLLAFHGVVVSLIGPNLSGQLLGAMWRNCFSGAGPAV